ncbi:hypothetical protein KIN20_002544 [Parelaphostrongylus tenuis]|uniref:Uncharacterized protein n=1 Tax=Parelaphostrongylus tenuis TaxID=148309 RepID=A0AAD5MED3_PARTN|nr:hypothetical protein KIN20_002544 [Parelaphostrongylus tenuis]
MILIYNMKTSFRLLHHPLAVGCISFLPLLLISAKHNLESLVGSRAEDSSPKPIPWKRHHEDLKKLSRKMLGSSSIMCTISNIPFGICDGVCTSSEDGPFKYLTKYSNWCFIVSSNSAKRLPAKDCFTDLKRCFLSLCNISGTTLATDQLGAHPLNFVMCFID